MNKWVMVVGGVIFVLHPQIRRKCHQACVLHSLHQLNVL